MAESAQLRETQRGPSYMVLLLGLNLILLAFFILLNALSNFESRKTHAVLDSVSHAFRGSIKTPEGASSVSVSLGVLPLPEALTKEVGSLFESFVPEARAKLTDRATVMTVEMPATSLFRPAAHEIRPERKVLIRRLARALMGDLNGAVKYELAFEHGISGARPPATGGQDAGAAAEVAARSVRRADAVARYLIRQSIPRHVLSVGLRPGAPGTVRFVLRVRPDAAPAETPNSRPGGP